MNTPIYQYRLALSAGRLQGLRQNSLAAQTLLMIQSELKDSWFTAPEFTQIYRKSHKTWGLPPAVRDTLQRRLAFLLEKGLLEREYFNPLNEIPPVVLADIPEDNLQPVELSLEELEERLKKDLN